MQNRKSGYRILGRCDQYVKLPVKRMAVEKREADMPLGYSRSQPDLGRLPNGRGYPGDNTQNRATGNHIMLTTA